MTSNEIMVYQWFYDVMWRHCMTSCDVTVWRHVTSIMTSHNELWGKRTRKYPTQEVRERSGVFILGEKYRRAAMSKLGFAMRRNGRGWGLSMIFCVHDVTLDVMCVREFDWAKTGPNPAEDQLENWANEMARIWTLTSRSNCLVNRPCTEGTEGKTQTFYEIALCCN